MASLVIVAVAQPQCYSRIRNSGVVSTGAIPVPEDGKCYHVLGTLFSSTRMDDAIGTRADLETFLPMVGKQQCFAVESMATGDIDQTTFPALFMPGNSWYERSSYKPILDAGLVRAIIVGMNMFDREGIIDTTTVLDRVATGYYDSSWLAPRVAQCKAFKSNNGTLYPVLIRLSPEFNQNWYAELMGKGGRAGNPTSFIAAWRHVVRYFRDNNVTNVSWQWSVGWNDAYLEVGTFRDYYPGDDYVDWIGIDAYWMGPADIMTNQISTVYNWIYLNSSGPQSKRPCSLSEWGYKNNVGGYSSDSSAAQYFTASFDTFENYTRIKMIRLHWASSDSAGNGFIFQNFDSTLRGYYPNAVAVYANRIANPRYIP